MSFIAASAISAGGSILGGLFGSSAAKKAAKAQLQAAREAMALQKEMYYDQVGRQEPFRQAGLSTTKELMRQFGLDGEATSAGYGNLLRDFAMSDYEQDPGYQFRLSEGMKALDRAAAARGGYLSGGALKAGQRYAQDAASQEYQNAYNRYNQNRMLRYNMLTGQQAVGQGATNAMGQAAQNYSGMASQTLADMGNARASGYMGSANALAGGLQGAANAFGNYSMLQYLNPQGGGLSGNVNPYSNPTSNALRDRLLGG
jgi:hypothetical protein